LITFKACDIRLLCNTNAPSYEQSARNFHCRPRSSKSSWVPAKSARPPSPVRFRNPSALQLSMLLPTAMSLLIPRGSKPNGASLLPRRHRRQGKRITPLSCPVPKGTVDPCGGAGNPTGNVFQQGRCIMAGQMSEFLQPVENLVKGHITNCRFKPQYYRNVTLNHGLFLLALVS